MNMTQSFLGLFVSEGGIELFNSTRSFIAFVVLVLNLLMVIGLTIGFFRKGKMAPQERAVLLAIWIAVMMVAFLCWRQALSN